LGASNSSYSLSEQLKLNSIFTDASGKKPSFEDIEALTTKMRKEWKVNKLKLVFTMSVTTILLIGTFSV